MPETYSRTINIYVESGEAQKAYDKLKVSQETLNKKIQTYLDQGKQVPEKLAKQFEAVNKQLDIQSKKLSGELSPSMRDLSSTVSKLNAELARMSKEDAGFEDKVRQANEAKAALSNYKSAIQSVGNSLRDMAKEAKGIALGVIIGNTVQSAIQSISGAFSGFVSGAAKVSDELTNIEKTTGLTAESVKSLSKDLGSIDTRTSNSKLREYATEAGKLGKTSVEDIRRFVEEANQINVALGEDLGEDAIKQIGKIADTFNTSMLKIGSAFNSVGAASSASESFLTDFTFRTQALGQTANISAADLIGFGAALDINGQQVEASSTALNTFFIDFIKNIEKFGATAGMAKGALTDIANTKGVNEAFLTFLENLKNGTTTTDEFLKKLEDIGIDGARGANTFLTLANNLGTVREQQQIANQAFEDGTSITNEYDKKNNNLAATLEKISKVWGKITSSSSVQEFLTSGAELTLKFLKALQLMPEWIQENSSTLITLTGAYVTYNASVIASNVATAYNTVVSTANLVVQKAKNAALFIGRGAVAAYALAQGVLTGQISLATAATWLFSGATAAATGGLTIIIGVITAAATAFAVYANRQRESLVISNMIADIHKKAALAVADEKSTLESLLLVAKDETASKEKRLAAIQKINELSPEYLGNITLETINTKEATKAIEAYLKALDVKAYKEALFEKRKELNRSLIEAENSSIEENIKWYDKLNAAIGSATVVGSYEAQTLAKGAVNRQAAINLINKQKAALDELEKKQIGLVVPNAVNPISGGISSTTNIGSGGSSADADKKSQASREKNLEEYNRYYQKLKDIQQEYSAALVSDDEKEIARLQIKYQALKAELDKFYTEKIIGEVQYRQTELLRMEDFNAEMKALSDKQFENRSEKEYAATLIVAQNHYEQLKAIQKQRLADGEINEREYNAIILTLDAQAAHAKAKIAQDYTETSKKAASDLVKFQNDAYQQDVNNAIAADKQKQDAKKAAAGLAMDTAKITGDYEYELSLKRRALDEEYEAQMAHWRLIEGGKEQNEALLTEIQANYKAKRDALNAEETQLSIQQFAHKAQGYLQYGQQILQISEGINQIITNQENAQIEYDKRKNNELVKNYGKQLQEKRISQKLHDILVDQANKAMAKKEDEIKKAQFERNKAFQIANAFMAGAQAVLQALASGPPPGNFIMAGLAGVAAGIQIGVISSTQYVPSYGDGTARLGGERHSGKNGGNPVIDPRTGKVIAKVEEGEAIIPQDATANNPEIVNMLLNQGRSRNLLSTMRPVSSLDISRNLSNIEYASGGVFGGRASRSGNSNVNAIAEAGLSMAKTNELLKAQTVHLKKIADKDVSVSIKETNKKSATYNDILTNNV